MAIKNIKTKIRRCTLEQLGALRVFTYYTPPIVTAKKLSEATCTADQSLGGVISSLSRITTKSGALIEPVGRERSGGVRWRLNESVIAKEELAELIDELLGKNLKWAENPYRVKKSPYKRKENPYKLR